MPFSYNVLHSVLCGKTGRLEVVYKHQASILALNKFSPSVMSRRTGLSAVAEMVENEPLS
jgi:hypothetical protein